MNQSDTETSGDKHHERRERRLHLWRLMNLGYSLRESVQQTAVAYRCSERTVYYDWSKRGYWLAKEFLLESLEEHLIEATAGMVERRRQTLEVLRKSQDGKNLAVQLGSLKLLYQMDRELLEQGRHTLRYISRSLLSRTYDDDIRSRYFGAEPAAEESPSRDSAR